MGSPSCSEQPTSAAPAQAECITAARRRQHAGGSTTSVNCSPVCTSHPPPPPASPPGWGTAAAGCRPHARSCGKQQAATQGGAEAISTGRYQTKCASCPQAGGPRGGSHIPLIVWPAIQSCGSPCCSPALRCSPEDACERLIQVLLISVAVAGHILAHLKARENFFINV
jgi:hypothetical protein